MISVIIPAYNAEKWIRQAVESVLAPDDLDVEVVAVDDGSTDDTLEVLEGLASHDARLRVFRQANAGSGPARNRAVREARGDCVFFLDADDWLDRGTLRAARSALLEQQADAAIPVLRKHDLATGTSSNTPAPALPLSGTEALELGAHWQISGLALWRAEIVRAHPFDERLAHFGDELTTLRRLRACTKIVGCEGAYNYRLHPASITHVPSLRQIERAMVDVEISKELERGGAASTTLDAFRVASLRRLFAFAVMTHGLPRQERTPAWEVIDAAHRSIDRLAWTSSVNRSPLSPPRRAALLAFIWSRQAMRAASVARSSVTTGLHWLRS